MGAPWFKLYAGDLLSDTKIRLLSDEQLGILLKLWAFNCKDGCLPSALAIARRLVGASPSDDLKWVMDFFVVNSEDPSKMHSQRMKDEQDGYTKKCERLRVNASKGGLAKAENALANATANTLAKPAESESESESEEEKIKINPLPPTGSGGKVKPVKSGNWLKAHPPELVHAAREILDLWPTPGGGHFQPGGVTPVPGVSPSELASRLAEVHQMGVELQACVQIAHRAVQEWKDGKWIKAPQYFFGKGKDSPFRAYYQAYVTNKAMSEAQHD